MKVKKPTQYEKFSKTFLSITTLIFVFGLTFVKSYEASYNKQVQVLEKEIEKTQADIDALEMQKQELTSFYRVAAIAEQNGCKYQSPAVASTISNQNEN